MSDTPQGGWWKAKDGKWYPPETHPDRVREAAGSVAAGPPAAGWWQANDGNWYPPETHPEQQSPTIDLTSSAVPAAEGIDGTGPTDGGSSVSDWSASSPAAGDGPVGGGSLADRLPDVSATTVDDLYTEDDLHTEGDHAAEAVQMVDSQWIAADAADTPVVPVAPQDASAFVLPTLPTLDDRDDRDAEARRPSLFVAPPAVAPDAAAVGGPATESSPLEVAGSDAPAPLFGGAPPLDEPRPAEFDLGSSDAPLPGWHKGADGAWYPPDQAAPTRSEVFPRATSPSPSPLGGPVESAPAAPSKLRWILAGAGALVLIVALAAFLLTRGGSDDDESAEPASESTEQTDAAPATTAAPSTTSAAPTTAVPDSPPPAQASGAVSGTVDVGRDVTEQYLALITHDGSGPFAARLLGADGQVTQELVTDASGPYLGVVLVNGTESGGFRSVQADATGPWAVTFAVLPSAPNIDSTSGSEYQGSGDEVVRVQFSEPTTVRFVCTSCPAPARIDGFGDGASTMSEEVDTVGDVVVPAGTTLVQVTVPSTGPAVNWSLTVP